MTDEDLLMVRDLIDVLENADQVVPPELQEMQKISTKGQKKRQRFRDIPGSNRQNNYHHQGDFGDLRRPSDFEEAKTQNGRY